MSCTYCEATFHRGCCKLPPALIDAVLAHIDLHWSCAGCTSMLKNPRCRSVKEMGVQAGFQAALASAVAAMGKLVEPIVAEVRSGFSLLQSASTPHNSCPDLQPAPGSKRRRVVAEFSSPDATYKNVNNHDGHFCAATSSYTNTAVRILPPSSLPGELMGTDPVTSPLRAVVPEPRVDRIWIRLSHLSTAVSVDQVIASVMRRLDTDDVIAYCLLRRGANVDTMNWLSFKVRVPAALRDKALTPSTWPVGVGVREFFPTHLPVNRHSSPAVTSHQFSSRTPCTSSHRLSTRTPTTTRHRFPADTLTITDRHPTTRAPAHDAPYVPACASEQLNNHTLDDTAHAPNSTLIDGPSQANRTATPNLHQATLDRFFHG